MKLLTSRVQTSPACPSHAGEGVGRCSCGLLTVLRSALPHKVGRGFLSNNEGVINGEDPPIFSRVTMAVEQRITPSTEARRLFSRMVARSDDHLKLSVATTLMLGVQLSREGSDPAASDEITELVSQNWIEPTPDGAWAIRGLVL